MSAEVRDHRSPAHVVRWQSRYSALGNESPTTTDAQRSSSEACPAGAFDPECRQSCATSLESARTQSAPAVLSRQVLFDCFHKPAAARSHHLRRGVENE